MLLSGFAYKKVSSVEVVPESQMETLKLPAERSIGLRNQSHLAAKVGYTLQDYLLQT